MNNTNFGLNGQRWEYQTKNSGNNLIIEVINQYDKATPHKYLFSEKFSILKDTLTRYFIKEDNDWKLLSGQEKPEEV